MTRRPPRAPSVRTSGLPSPSKSATLRGGVLKLLSFPFIILTLGIASLIINAFMLMVAAYFVDGFSVSGFIPAFIGSILMSIINFVLGMFVPDGDRK